MRLIEQIYALVRDQNFVRKKNDKERGVLFSFEAVIENFLGKKKANDYKTFVTNLLSTFPDPGCKINVKLNFLYNHLDRFPEKLGVVSDE